MTEEFIQFIWKYGLFEQSGLFTDAGDEVRVISLGEQNQDSGPDFTNSRIRIGATTWAGNVEIHLRSADWYVHGHQNDKAYDNVILHVVYHDNRPAVRSNGVVVPTLVLPCDEKLFARYQQLIGPKGTIPCQGKIKQVDPLVLDCWLSSLVVDRLRQKAEQFTNYLQGNTFNWEEAFYISLARSFGFGLNSGPFERVARSLPLSLLYRHRDNPLQVEALLLGQAGFLGEGNLFPGYHQALKTEYLHLRRKYKLKPIEKHLWKFLRLRPVNFPAIRLVQFAGLIRQSEGLFSQILSCNEFHELRGYFSVGVPEFWNTHYTFDKTSVAKNKTLGEEAFYSIVINTLIPFLFVYASLNGMEEVKEKALDWLNRVPPESNRVTRRWDGAGVHPSSAFYSQALLQLSENYCSRRRCLACSVGTSLIRSGA